MTGHRHCERNGYTQFTIIKHGEVVIFFMLYKISFNRKVFLNAKMSSNREFGQLFRFGLNDAIQSGKADDPTGFALRLINIAKRSVLIIRTHDGAAPVDIAFATEPFRRHRVFCRDFVVQQFPSQILLSRTRLAVLVERDSDFATLLLITHRC